MATNGFRALRGELARSLICFDCRMLASGLVGIEFLRLQGGMPVTRKCTMVCLAVGMLISAVQTEAQVAQQSPSQSEVAIRACRGNCELVQKECRSEHRADCSKEATSCNNSCKKLVGRPQQQQQPTSNQEASRRFCESNCSMSRSSCEGMCGMKSDFIESESCRSSCRTSEWSCQNSCGP